MSAWLNTASTASAKSQKYSWLNHRSPRARHSSSRKSAGMRAVGGRHPHPVPVGTAGLERLEEEPSPAERGGQDHQPAAGRGQHGPDGQV